MKRIALVAGAVASVVLAGTATAAPSRVGSVVVTGRAGTMASVTFSSPVSFTNGGPDIASVASRGGWAAVAVIAAGGKPVDRPVLVATSLGESFRCPDASCPYSAGGPPVFGSGDGTGEPVLPAGRYQVVLFGEPDAQVTVRLAPRGLRAHRTYRTSAKPLRYLAETSQGRGTPGHDTQLHAYSQMPPGGAFGLMAMYNSMALDPAGAMSSTGCITSGSTNTTTRSVGGVAPCADFQGIDFIFGPDAGPVADRVGGAYAPVQVSSIAQWGRSDDATFGVGYDTTAVAATSHLRSLAIGVELG